MNGAPPSPAPVEQPPPSDRPPGGGATSPAGDLAAELWNDVAAGGVPGESEGSWDEAIDEAEADQLPGWDREEEGPGLAGDEIGPRDEPTGGSWERTIDDFERDQRRDRADERGAGLTGPESSDRSWAGHRGIGEAASAHDEARLAGRAAEVQHPPDAGESGTEGHQGEGEDRGTVQSPEADRRPPEAGEGKGESRESLFAKLREGTLSRREFLAAFHARGDSFMNMLSRGELTPEQFLSWARFFGWQADRSASAVSTARFLPQGGGPRSAGAAGGPPRAQPSPLQQWQQRVRKSNDAVSEWNRAAFDRARARSLSGYSPLKRRLLGGH